MKNLNKFMKKVLDRLRGSPEILATLVVGLTSLGIALFCMFVAYISSPKIEILGEEFLVIFAIAIMGASVGVSFTFFLDVVRQILGRPDLHGIPLDIAEGARNEVFDIGYYRANCKMIIELCVDKDKNQKLTISLESDIFTRSDRASMRFPDLDPSREPKSLSGEPEKSIVYRHNGRIIYRRQVFRNENHMHRQIIRLNKCEIIQEHLEVSYSIGKKDPKPDGYLEDGMHRWRSSVSGGLTVEARLPDGYQFRVFALIGDERVYMREKESIEKTENPSGNKTFTYIYIYDDSFFSQQGIHWCINKIQDQHSRIRTSGEKND